ncbi:MAG: hypothetical protein PHU23_00985 [Dehalococcoidales bacterium]|nr:hypothetical protein [Dehalococcoidales bacterium]
MSSGDKKEHYIPADAPLIDNNIDSMTRLLSEITRQVEEMKQLRRLMQSKDTQIINLDIITEELLTKLKEANVAYTLSNQIQSLRLENEVLKRRIKKLESESEKSGSV